MNSDITGNGKVLGMMNFNYPLLLKEVAKDQSSFSCYMDTTYPKQSAMFVLNESAELDYSNFSRHLRSDLNSNQFVEGMMTSEGVFTPLGMPSTYQKLKDKGKRIVNKGKKALGKSNYVKIHNLVEYDGYVKLGSTNSEPVVPKDMGKYTLNLRSAEIHNNKNKEEKVDTLRGNKLSDLRLEGVLRSKTTRKETAANYEMTFKPPLSMKKLTMQSLFGDENHPKAVIMKGKRPRMVGNKIVFNEKDVAFEIRQFDVNNDISRDVVYRVVFDEAKKEKNAMNEAVYYFFFTHGMLTEVRIRFTSVKVPFTQFGSLSNYESEFVDFAVGELVQYHDLSTENLSHLIEPRLEFIMNHLETSNNGNSLSIFKNGLNFMGNLISLLKNDMAIQGFKSSTLQPKASQLNTSQLYRKLSNQQVQDSMNLISFSSPSDEYLRSMNQAVRLTVDTSYKNKDMDKARMIFDEIKDILGLGENTKEIQSFMTQYMNLLFGSLLHSMHTLVLSKSTESSSSSTKSLSTTTTITGTSYSNFKKHWNEC